MRLLNAFGQPIGLDDVRALLVRKLADRLEELIDRDLVVVKGFLDDDHCVLHRLHFAVELNQLLRERAVGLHVLVDVVQVNRSRLLLTNDLLEVLVLLLEGLHVRVDLCQSLFEVVDLVIEDFVVRVDGNFAVDKGIDCLGNLCEVLLVQIIEFSHQRLRISRRHTRLLLVILL